MNEYTARECTILGILRNQYAMFAKNEQPMNAYNYSAIDWDELTALAVVAPEYVAYIPPNPKGNPMYETGKHVILPAIMNLPENIGKVKASEENQPASVAMGESEATEYTLKIDKNFEDMAFMVAPDGRVITTGSKIATSRVAMNLLNSETEKLRQQVAKLEADLVTAQERSVNLENALQTATTERGEFGAMSMQRCREIIGLNEKVEKYSHMAMKATNENVDLKAENARIIGLVMNSISDLENGSPTSALNVLDKIVQSASIESPEASQTVSPVTVKKPVSARMHIRWNERGFSSGDYEVLGHSQEKQAYLLNISTDETKPMPKWVKFTDCQ